ncbi:hypothetical protein PGSY75_1353300 [Plasmodium gaboni]|uniref:t-SNARE coiled-coil homology domain-containing protein n=1 Tax=Plasmodium gaboni TaxID=647221 RepID=A0A151LEA7_9APIC|nr:hypothetical protein PGSY75_1353300 [Plasmodium gaboni]KYN97302.1 hypothetical protein PGSY75_1353300 [Plasmodium gaboni]
MDFFTIIFILLLAFFFFDYNFCSRGLVFYIGNKSLKLLKKCNNLEKAYRSTIYLIFPFLQHIFVHIFYYYIEKKKEYLNNLIFEQSKERYDIRGQKEFDSYNFKKEDIFNYIIEGGIKIKNYVYNKVLHIFFFIVEYTNIYENINLNCYINTREVLNNNNFGVVIIDYYLPNTSIKKKKKKKKKKDQTSNNINDSEKIDLYDLVNIKQEKKIKFVLIDNKWKNILGIGKIEDPNVQHLYLQDTVLIQYLQFSWIFKNHFLKKLYNDTNISTHNYYDIEKKSMQQNDRDSLKEKYKKTSIVQEELNVDGNICSNTHLNDNVNIKEEEYINKKNFMNDQEEIIIQSLKRWDINKENVFSNKEGNFNLITNNSKIIENKDSHIETEKMKEDDVYNNITLKKKKTIIEIEQNNINTQNNNCHSNKQKHYINEEKKKQQLKYIKNQNMIRDKLKMHLNRWKYKNIKGIIVILPEIFYNYINMNDMENKIPIYYFLKKDIKIDTFTVIAKLLGYICIHIHININFGFSIPFIFKSKTTNILNISNNFNLHMNKNLFNIYNENGTCNIKGEHTNISSVDKKFNCSKYISKGEINNNNNSKNNNNNNNIYYTSVSHINDNEKDNNNKQDNINLYTHINDHISMYNNDNNEKNSFDNNVYNKENDKIKDTINYMEQNDKNYCHDLSVNNNYNERSNEYDNNQQYFNNINDDKTYQNNTHNNNINNINNKYIHADYTTPQLNSILENKIYMDENYAFLFSTPFSFFSDNYNDLNIAMNHFKAIFKNYNFVFLCFNDGTNIMLNYFLEKIYKKKKTKTPGGMTTLISTAGVAENIKNTFNLYNTNAYKCHINNYKKKHVHDTKGDTYDNEKKGHSKLYAIDKSEEDKKTKGTLNKPSNKSNIMSLFFGEKKKKNLEHEQMNESQRFKRIIKKWNMQKILSDIKGNDKSSFINEDKKVNEKKHNKIDKNDTDDSNASYDDEKILSHVVKEQMHSGKDEKEELVEPKENGIKSFQEEDEEDEDDDQGVDNYDNYVDDIDKDVENYDKYIDDIDQDVENYDKIIDDIDKDMNDDHKNVDDEKKVDEVIPDVEREDKNLEEKNINANTNVKVNVKDIQYITEHYEELTKKHNTNQNINIDKNKMNQINNAEFLNNVENIQDSQKNNKVKEEMFTKNIKKNMKIKMKNNENNDMGKLRNIKEKLKKKKMETLMNLSKLNIFHKNSEQMSEKNIKEDDDTYKDDYNTNESKIWNIYDSHVSNDPRGSASTYKSNCSINKFANMSLSNFASFIKKHKTNNSHHNLVGRFKNNLGNKENIPKENSEINMNKCININKEKVMEIDMKEFVETNINHDVEKNEYNDINKNTNNEIVKSDNIVDEKILNTEIPKKYINYNNEKNIKEDVEGNIENTSERDGIKNSEIRKIKLNILEKFRKKEIRKCDNMDDTPGISNKFRYSFFKIRNRFKNNYNTCDNKTNQEKKNMERDKMMMNSFIKNKNAKLSDENSTSTADSNFDDYGKKHTKEICILINFSYNNMFDIFNYPDDFIETKKRKFSIVHKFFYSLNIFFNSFSTLIKQRYFFRCTSELSNFLKRSLFYDFYNNSLCKISTDDQIRNKFLLDINNSSNEYDSKIKGLSDITYISNTEKANKPGDLLENKSNIISVCKDKENVNGKNISTYISKDMECTWNDNNKNNKCEKNLENIKNDNIEEIDKIDLINNNNNSEHNTMRSKIQSEIYNNVSDMNKKNISNNLNNAMEYNKNYAYNNSSIRDSNNNNMILNETYNNKTFCKDIYSDSFESKIRVYFNIKSLYEKWKIYFEDKRIDISIQDKFLYNLSFIYNVYNYLILIYIYTYYNEESYITFCNNQKFYQFIEKVHCYFNEKKYNQILYKILRNNESFNSSIIPNFLNYHDYKLLKVFFFMLQNSSNKFISKNIHLFNFPVVFIFSSDSKNFNFNHFDIIKISKNNNIIYLLYKRGNEGLFLSGLKPYIWIYRVLFDFVESLFLSSFDN